MEDTAVSAIFRRIALMILIGCTVGCGTGYQRVHGQWCYVTVDSGHGRRARELPVDMHSFNVLSGGLYAKDKDSVLFKGRMIENADPSTFTPIPQTTSRSTSNSKYRLTIYGKDKTHVYLRDRAIIGADPTTFRVVEGPYSRDNMRFYCGSVPMDVAHPDTFEVVFWNGTDETAGDVLVQSYGPSFKAVDPTAIVIIGRGWARDGEFYYCGPRRITGRDYATLEIIDENDARDKNGEFNGDLRFQNIQHGDCVRPHATSVMGSE